MLDSAPIDRLSLLMLYPRFSEILMFSPRILFKVKITHRPSPCAWLSQTPSTTPDLTPYLSLITPFRLPRFYTCRSILASLQERIGPPTFTTSLSLHAMLFDSGGDRYTCRLTLYLLLPSGPSTPWATSHRMLTELNRVQPFGLWLAVFYAYA